MAIALGLMTFTMLWVISCTILYFGLIRRNEEAFQKVFEAHRLYEDAKTKNVQAQRDMEQAMLRLQQIENSLHSLN